MKTILIIGIGAGDPEHVTMQAVTALNRVDVFFILDKGTEKAALGALRAEILRRYVTRAHRIVHADSPDWTRGESDYQATIAGLNRDKQAVFERLIAEELADGQCGAFLVWGEPALYDSTIRNVAALVARGHAIDYAVIPGISAVQALAARHKAPLNRVGGAVAITTGRRLAAGWPDGADDVVVMLDAHTSFTHYADQDLEIQWGAYVGAPNEILIAGKLADVADEIVRTRAAARQANGWIMDTYILRRPATPSSDDEA